MRQVGVSDSRSSLRWPAGEGVGGDHSVPCPGNCHVEEVHITSIASRRSRTRVERWNRIIPSWLGFRRHASRILYHSEPSCVLDVRRFKIDKGASFFLGRKKCSMYMYQRIVCVSGRRRVGWAVVLVLRGTYIHSRVCLPLTPLPFRAGATMGWGVAQLLFVQPLGRDGFARGGNDRPDERLVHIF